MATFISLLNFTDQGIRNVKDSPARLEAVKGCGRRRGHIHLHAVIRCDSHTCLDRAGVGAGLLPDRRELLGHEVPLR